MGGKLSRVRNYRAVGTCRAFGTIAPSELVAPSELSFRRNELLGGRGSLKETAAVPTRTLGAVGDSFDDLQISSVELSRGFEVDRLLKIVRRRVVALLSPTLHDFVFG